MSIDIIPQAADWNRISNKPSVALGATTISTTAPLQGGGDLSANRTFSIDPNPIVWAIVFGG